MFFNVVLGDTPTTANTYADVSSYTNLNNTLNSITTLGTRNIILTHPGFTLL